MIGFGIGLITGVVLCAILWIIMSIEGIDI